MTNIQYCNAKYTILHMKNYKYRTLLSMTHKKVQTPADATYNAVYWALNMSPLPPPSDNNDQT